MGIGRYPGGGNRAYTLVEIIVAAMVLVLLFGGVFKLFRSGSEILKGGMWVNKAQNQVRNTLTLLRDEIAKASEFSKVTASGVEKDTSVDTRFRYRKGTIDKTYSGPIFRFYQCKTAIDLPGQSDGGSIVVCEVTKRNAQLVMTKRSQKGTPDEKMFTDRVLLDDLVEIKIDEPPALPNEGQMAQSMVKIVITVGDPTRKERQVTEESEAKIDAEVQGL